MGVGVTVGVTVGVAVGAGVAVSIGVDVGAGATCLGAQAESTYARTMNPKVTILISLRHPSRRIPCRPTIIEWGIPI